MIRGFTGTDRDCSNYATYYVLAKDLGITPNEVDSMDSVTIQALLHLNNERNKEEQSQMKRAGR